MYWVYRRHRYLVLAATLPLRQSTDYAGRPSGRVVAQLVRFTLDVGAGTLAALADYMFDPYRRAPSHFEVEYENGSCRPWLELQAAYLVRLTGEFAPARPQGWPGEVLHLGLSPAALVKQGLTLECHAVLPWYAPSEVQRRARLEGSTLAEAARMPAPKGRPPQVTAPALARPPTLAGTAQKGVYGEHVSDTYMRAQGHVKLNDGGRLTPPPPGGTARGNGLDGVWRHASPPPDYVITEAKYGTAQLAMTQDGRQMSDGWIRGSNRLERATSPKEAIRIRSAMRGGRVEKRLHKITAQGTLIETILL